MASYQIHKTSEVVCTDKTCGHDHHHNKHDSYNTTACQTTCHGTTGAQTHYGAKPDGHGYNGDANQVHGCSGATQVHGHGHGAAAAGMACYGKKTDQVKRRSHKKHMDGHGSDSCSSGSDRDSDSESDDEKCRRRC